MHDGRRGNKPTERALHDVFGALRWVAGLVKLQRLRHQLARDDDLRHREFSVQNIQSQPGADMSVDLFSERGLGLLIRSGWELAAGREEGERTEGGLTYGYGRARTQTRERLLGPLEERYFILVVDDGLEGEGKGIEHHQADLPRVAGRPAGNDPLVNNDDRHDMTCDGDGANGWKDWREVDFTRASGDPGNRKEICRAGGRSDADIRLWSWKNDSHERASISAVTASSMQGTQQGTLTDGCAARYAGRVRMKTTNSTGVCNIL